MEISTVVASGAMKSCMKYRKMVGDAVPPPESFLQSMIALELSKEFPYVVMEGQVKGLRQEVGIKHGGKLGKGRVDIIVYWKNGNPRALIEAKMAWEDSKCDEDAQRLRGFIDHSESDIKSAFLVAYCSAASLATIDARFEEISRRTGFRLVVNMKVPEAPNHHWGIACLEYRKPR